MALKSVTGPSAVNEFDFTPPISSDVARHLVCHFMRCDAKSHAHQRDMTQTLKALPVRGSCKQSLFRAAQMSNACTTRKSLDG
eukprot:CAMPEP_0195160534 /NCGR_PEP_ID=MMETSP0448-20130528/186715_1 /TAXON_ID=66468 /ORGANISM="Heterocapsa triquestra, Strain CCMP 448" /LENGTH=82 /DNA_ID=CAMNT_0040199335 /DNA_START=861 /DNA_END=1109 /DNA_ORIENTATION=+